jgi:hypothetical protein
MATTTTGSGEEIKLTLKSDIPSKRALITVPSTTTLAALVGLAARSLTIDAESLARYSIRAAGLGSDVIALSDGSGGAGDKAARPILDLGVLPFFQILFFAPADLKPARKKRGKAGEVTEAKRDGDEAKFAGLSAANILGKLRAAKGKAKTVALEFVDRYFQEIIKTQRKDLVALPKALLIEILQRDELDAKEPDLFALSLEWGKSEAKKAGLRPEGDDLKKIMADVIPHIRFPCLTATEMALTVTPARLLTAEQELQLYTHIGKVSGKRPAEAAKEEKKGAKKEHPRVAGFISVSRKPFGILKAATSRFEDNTGIFWFLGTDDGKRGYINPIETEVGARMSTLVGSLPSLADRNYTSTPVENTYGSDSAPWIEFEFRRWKVRPTSYFLAQEQDHYLRNWRIEGSDDGSSWTTIREHTNDSTIHTSNRWAFFELKADKFYKRLKLQMTGPSHNGSTNMDVTQMEWFGYITPSS